MENLEWYTWMSNIDVSKMEKCIQGTTGCPKKKVHTLCWIPVGRTQFHRDRPDEEDYIYAEHDPQKGE